ncbi:MAG: DUF1428 domain-containing protein [Pseudomonadota bacterium]
MSYVDGFVVAVPRENRDAYEAFARQSASVFRDHGALRVVECWADDVPEGTLTSFPFAVRCKPTEIVVFSWVEWPSREARDVGNRKVMADRRMQASATLPFDGMRLIFGGFDVLLDA